MWYTTNMPTLGTAHIISSSIVEPSRYEIIIMNYENSQFIERHFVDGPIAYAIDDLGWKRRDSIIRVSSEYYTVQVEKLPEQDTTFEKFRLAHPLYSVSHIVAIQDWSTAHNVPWCEDCNEWHPKPARRFNVPWCEDCNEWHPKPARRCQELPADLLTDPD